MHIDIDKNKCCGCNACIKVCPVKAIEEDKDILGFSYPKVNEEKCIQCGKCVRVCQIGQIDKHEEFVQEYYAGQNKNKQVLRESSSGGIFDALSEAILEQGGVIYGVAFDGEWNVVHQRAENSAEVVSFHGSKYIQSNNLGIYEQIKSDLKAEHWVLFSGTPCQCQGLKKYLNEMKIDSTKLVLVDFVCHGVSSPTIWKQYIDCLSQDRGEIAHYTFRNKDLGWKKSRIKITNEAGEDVSDNKFSFFELYRSLLITRKSCFGCDFTSFKRCTDITLGDFWNIDKLENNLDVDAGVSQILVNSEKGKELFESITDEIEYLRCEKMDCWQPHLEYPVEIPGGRAKFEQYYAAYSFENVLQKYGHGTFVGKCKKVMMPIVKKMGLYVIAGKIYNLIFGKGRKKN